MVVVVVFVEGQFLGMIFFFHVDQLLVQLIFHFNSYHPAATCYNQTSSKLNNAETVGIYRGGGGLELQAEYEFEKQ